MSTKVYNGIKFKSNKLSTVIRQLNSLKEESIKNVMDTFNNEKNPNFLRMCVLYRECLQKGEHLKNYWNFSRILKDKLRNPWSDYGFTFKFGVTIFERKNKLYGIYFDQTYLNYNMLFDRDIAVDYHYQDQTDKPEDISNRDWYFREQVWEDIFEDISVLWIPSEAGVVYDIVDEDNIEITEELYERIKVKSEEFLKKKEESDE